MALKVGDRVKQTSTTTGTGTITLNGAAPTGFSNFRDYLSDGDTTYYVIEDGTNYEVGLGTFNTGGSATADTIARSSNANVYRSTNSNNRVDWSSGTRSVFISLPSDKAVFKDANGTTKVASFETSATSILGNDVLLMSGSGYHLLWDSSESALDFADTSEIRMGATDDLVIYHNGTHSYIDNNDGILYITQKTDDSDIVFMCDDQAGGTANYILLDGSEGEVKLSYASSGSSSVKLTTKPTGVDITGTITADVLTVAADTDATTTLGRALIHSPASDGAGFSHVDKTALTDYALFQSSNGTTYINASSGTNINFNNNNSNVAYISSTGLRLGAGKDLMFEGATGDNFETFVTVTDPTADRTITLPDATGTVALTSDITGSIAADDITTGDAAVTIATTTGNITIDAQEGDADIIFKGTDNTTDITALTLDMSAGGSATFNNNVQVGGLLYLDGNIDFTVNGKIIQFGASNDVTLTHVTNTGLLLNSSRQLQFGDSGTYIHQSADGVLDLVADTELELNGGIVDINSSVGDINIGAVGGNVVISGDTGHMLLTNTFNNGKIILTSPTLELDSNAGNIELTAVGGNVLVAGDTGAMTFTNSGTGNITIDAQGNNTDIIFKGTDNNADITMLTLDASLEGRATFNSDVVADQFSGNIYIGYNKEIRFEGSSLNSFDTILTVIDPTNTTKTISLPDATGTVSLITATETLTNKTLTTPVINGFSGTGDGSIDGDLTLTGANYNVVWDKSDDALEFADDAKATFGTGADLTIRHQSSNNTSYIEESGTGHLVIKGHDVFIQNAAGDTNIAKFTDGGGVNLYHNSNTPTFVTTSTGVDVTGSITASGNITAYSDERLKSNIKTIDNALDKVTKLRGVSYTKEDTQGIGVIAQEVEKVIPEVVHDGEYKSVDYGNIVGVLIEAIKEQQKQIDEQQKQIFMLQMLMKDKQGT